ncbi:MAG: hypothetical protein IT372_19495 [Polyangiaceae bacterium]|nr:hypothetical protein [Polyangiaceae bacterium]
MSDAAVDGAGNVIAVGGFSGTADFGGGPVTAAGSAQFIAKYSPAGSLIWLKQLDHVGGIGIERVATGPSGDITVLIYMHDGNITLDPGVITGCPMVKSPVCYAIVRYDAAGAHGWNHHYMTPSSGGASLQPFHDLAVDAAGDVLLTGSCEGSCDLGAGLMSGPVESSFNGSANTTVLKLGGAAGTPLWSTMIGVVGPDAGRFIGVTGAGDVLVAGKQETPDNLNDPVERGVFAARLSAAGAPVWRRYLGVTMDGTTALHHAAIDPAGHTMLTGHFANGIDFGAGPLSAGRYLIKLDPSSGTLWTTAISGAQATAMSADGLGNLFFAGVASAPSYDLGSGPTPTPGGMLAAWVDAATGAPYDSRVYTGATSYAVTAFAADAAGRAVIGGGFTGTLDFGQGPIAGPSAQNGFLAKLAP